MFMTRRAGKSKITGRIVLEGLTRASGRSKPSAPHESAFAASGSLKLTNGTNRVTISTRPDLVM